MAGPLTGIKILDFTWALAGPYGVMVLTDLGAEVWKIEAVGRTEDNRDGGPMVDGINTYHFSVNRGKHSLCVDLKEPEGKEIIYQLARHADVLTENFKPGVMERLGLGADRMRQENPRLIYASTSGFGQTGPYRDRGAVDIIVQGMGGVMSITGYPDQPPARPGYSIGDMAGGLFTAIGVLSALYEREKSAEGQRVDVAMLDAQVALMENAIVRYCATGQTPRPVGTRHPLGTPFEAYPAADGYIVIAGVKDWELFCAAIGRDDMMHDPRFVTNPQRLAHYQELIDELYPTFRQKTMDEWIEQLAKVCLIGPLNTVDRVVSDPHINAREMIVELPAWNGTRLKVASTPVKLSRTPGRPTVGPERPGGSTVRILRDVLGFSDERIQDLAKREIIVV